jgi:hypothetical protein
LPGNALTEGRDQVGYRQPARRPSAPPPPQEPRPRTTPCSLLAASVPTTSCTPCGRPSTAFRTAARSVPLSLPSPISTNRLSHNLTWFRDRGREGERNVDLGTLKGFAPPFGPPRD